MKKGGQTSGLYPFNDTFIGGKEKIERLSRRRKIIRISFISAILAVSMILIFLLASLFAESSKLRKNILDKNLSIPFINQILEKPKPPPVINQSLNRSVAPTSSGGGGGGSGGSGGGGSSCTPNCTGKPCGDNGCGGSCGTCNSWCNWTDVNKDGSINSQDYNLTRDSFTGFTSPCNISSRWCNWTDVNKDSVVNSQDLTLVRNFYNVSSGSCSGCLDQCSYLQKRCSESKSQICDDINSDYCLEWGRDSNCNYGCNSSTGECNSCSCPSGYSCNSTGQCVGVITISSCSVLNNSNSFYKLTSNIINNTITTDCIIISAQNITLDCNGFYISSVKNYSGIYSNQYKTTIKNCNISMGTGGNANSIGIELTDVADYSTIINNTIRGESYYAISTNAEYQNIFGNDVSESCSDCGGIILSGADNNTVDSNIANYNNVFGIEIASSSNVTIKNNIVSYNINVGNYGGIEVYNSRDSSVINNTLINNTNSGIRVEQYSLNINTSGNYVNTKISNSLGVIYSYSNNSYMGYNDVTTNSNVGIYLFSSSNNTLINNIGTSNSSVGIYLSSSSNNTLINNSGVSNSNIGIYLYQSPNDILISNTGKSNLSVGIYLISSSNNILSGNTGTSNLSVGIDIRDSSNNNLMDNIGITKGNSYGLLILNGSNNKVIKQRAEGGFAGSVGIGISYGGNHSVVKDCLNISGLSYDVYVTSNSINNTFINCSYRNTGSYETVGSGSSLIRKWWYRANVIGANNTPVNALVNAINSSGQLEFNIFTNQDGLTNPTPITDYVNLGGIRSFYSNYTINATNNSYSPNFSSHGFNASLGNNYNDVFDFSQNQLTGMLGTEKIGLLNRFINFIKRIIGYIF